MKEEKIIMYDSDEAARPVKATVFVSYNGYTFLDEQSARYHGCTHVKCRDCNATIPKGRTICDECDEKLETAKWLKREEKEWNGDTIIYSESHDEYFEDADALKDYLDDQDEKPSLESLRLVICAPEMYKTIDPFDHYADELPEEAELCDEICEAFKELNEKIKACKRPICLVPGKFRPTNASILKELGCGE